MATSKIHGNKATSISSSEVQQSYYTINNICRVYSDGCFTYVNVVVTCVTPYQDNPGANVLSGLLMPMQDVYISIPPNGFTDTARALRVCANHNGLHCRYGAAGKDYDICFMYPNKRVD